MGDALRLNDVAVVEMVDPPVIPAATAVAVVVEDDDDVLVLVFVFDWKISERIIDDRVEVDGIRSLADVFGVRSRSPAVEMAPDIGKGSVGRG